MSFQPQPLGARIARDWYNELLALDIIYKTDGLDAVVEHLCNSPRCTYEERRDKLLEARKSTPELYADIKQEYAITEQNAVIVRILNRNVRALNLAAKQGILTNEMYNWLIKRLWVYGQIND
ncbi:hypothetical protein HYX02_03540 [Candidatus Woesearchaeota archaeon]|nr:hypothetical protein [Candidatus Woesearchaeota archaeon]